MADGEPVETVQCDGLLSGVWCFSADFESFDDAQGTEWFESPTIRFRRACPE
jgi:hypothetical protein